MGYTRQGLPFVSLTTKSTAIAAYMTSYAQEVTGAERTVKRNTRDAIYNILYTKENAQQLAAHVYYPGGLSLERKQLAALGIAWWVRPAGMERRPPRIQWTAEMDRILLAAPTIAAAAAELGYSQSPCQNRRWKLLHGVVPIPTEQ